MIKMLAAYGPELVKWILGGFGWIMEKTIKLIMDIIIITSWTIYIVTWMPLFLTLWIKPKLWKHINGVFLQEIYDIFFAPKPIIYNQVTSIKKYNSKIELLNQYQKATHIIILRRKIWNKYFRWFERACTNGILNGPKENLIVQGVLLR